MLKIDFSLCRGCGLCQRVCPSGAISFIYGKASINQDKCVKCYRCVQVCPQNAIKEEVIGGYSLSNVANSLNELKRKIDSLSERVNAFSKNGKKRRKFL